MIKQVVDGISISVFLAFLACLVLITPLWIFVPDFEGKYFPVLTSVTVQRISSLNNHDKNLAWYNISYKPLRTCKILDTTKLYVVDVVGKTRVALDWKNVKVFDNLDRTFVNNIGVDTINRKFLNYVIVFSHSCHPLGETHTIINIPNG